MGMWRKAQQAFHRRPAALRVASVALALVVLAGAASWMAGTRAARTTQVGYVDVDRVLGEILAGPLRQETERLQKEFDEKAQDLDEQQRQQLFNQYQQMLDRRYHELGTAELPRVREAISQVAQEQNLDVVVHAGAVVWGGQDITPQVLARLGVRSGNASQGRSSGGSGGSSQGR